MLLLAVATNLTAGDFLPALKIGSEFFITIPLYRNNAPLSRNWKRASFHGCYIVGASMFGV